MVRCGGVGGKHGAVADEIHAIHQFAEGADRGGDRDVEPRHHRAGHRIGECHIRRAHRLLVERLDVGGGQRVLVNPHIIQGAFEIAPGAAGIVAENHGPDQITGDVSDVVAGAFQAGGIAQEDLGAIRADAQGDQAGFVGRWDQGCRWLPSAADIVPVVAQLVVGAEADSARGDGGAGHEDRCPRILVSIAFDPCGDRKGVCRQVGRRHFNPVVHPIEAHPFAGGGRKSRLSRQHAILQGPVVTAAHPVGSHRASQVIQAPVIQQAQHARTRAEHGEVHPFPARSIADAVAEPVGAGAQGRRRRVLQHIPPTRPRPRQTRNQAAERGGEAGGNHGQRFAVHVRIVAQHVDHHRGVAMKGGGIEVGTRRQRQGVSAEILKQGRLLVPVAHDLDQFRARKVGQCVVAAHDGIPFGAGAALGMAAAPIVAGLMPPDAPELAIVRIHSRIGEGGSDDPRIAAIRQSAIEIPVDQRGQVVGGAHRVSRSPECPDPLQQGALVRAVGHIGVVRPLGADDNLPKPVLDAGIAEVGQVRGDQRKLRAVERTLWRSAGGDEMAVGDVESGFDRIHRRSQATLTHELLRPQRRRAAGGDRLGGSTLGRPGGARIEDDLCPNRAVGPQQRPRQRARAPAHRAQVGAGHVGGVVRVATVRLLDDHAEVGRADRPQHEINRHRVGGGADDVGERGGRRGLGRRRKRGPPEANQGCETGVAEDWIHGGQAIVHNVPPPRKAPERGVRGRPRSGEI